MSAAGQETSPPMQPVFDVNELDAKSGLTYVNDRVCMRFVLLRHAF
jgi:hypothetical protein